MTATGVKCQIERVIRRGPSGARAEFLLLGDLKWCCCEAWVPEPGGTAGIQCRGSSLTVEQAAVVGVALQMAIDWVAEEIAAKQGASPAPGEPPELSFEVTG